MLSPSKVHRPTLMGRDVLALKTHIPGLSQRGVTKGLPHVSHPDGTGQCGLQLSVEQKHYTERPSRGLVVSSGLRLQDHEVDREPRSLLVTT